MTTDELKAKGITQRNYLWHLDELTDEEIAEFLHREPDAKRLANELASDPMPVRKFAEEIRDLY